MNIPLVDLRAQYGPLKDEIIRGMEQALEGMHLFLGENVQAFEREFAQFCGVKHGIGVSDGTAALHIILRALGIGAGDEVITVSHTFIATAEAIILAGARPVFVDIDPDTYLMDVGQIEAKITPRTKAIMPVHLYGQTADMDPHHGDRVAPWPEGDRGCLPGARRRVQGPASGQPGRCRGVQLLLLQKPGGLWRRRLHHDERRRAGAQGAHDPGPRLGAALLPRPDRLERPAR